MTAVHLLAAVLAVTFASVAGWWVLLWAEDTRAWRAHQRRQP